MVSAAADEEDTGALELVTTTTLRDEVTNGGGEMVGPAGGMTMVMTLELMSVYVTV